MSARSFRGPRLALVASLVLLGAGCADDVAQQAQPVVYGSDDRQDVYAHPSAALRTLARQSIVALIRARHVDASDPMNVTFPSPTLAVEESLCAGERFGDDPTAAYCSGTLIDDDLVLTAGHCVETAAECSDTRLAFNYYRDSATTLARATADDLFQCAEIVTRQYATLADGTELDYEIVRIDRSATPRFAPAAIRRRSVVSMGQPIAVIGFGSGVPAKIDSGGTVTDPRLGFSDYFDANTDTFGGSSGSGVFDLASNELIGILARGATDYVDRGGCFVVNQCSATPGAADCDGESISHVQRALDEFCAHHSSARLCPTPDAGADGATADASDAMASDSATTDSGAVEDARDEASDSAAGPDARDAQPERSVSDGSVSDSSASSDGSTGPFVASGGCQCSARGPVAPRAWWPPVALAVAVAVVAQRRQARRSPGCRSA